MKKITVDAKAFAEAMNKVSRVLKKSALPMLEEIAVSVKDGRCTLAATDMDTWLAAELPAQGDDLSFVFQRTKDVMKACAHFEGELALTLDTEDKKNWKLELHCGQRAATFTAASHEDYPECRTVENDASLRVNAAELFRSVERVRYAVQRADPSTNPKAACIQVRGNRIFSLDGRRMACDTQPDIRSTHGRKRSRMSFSSMWRGLPIPSLIWQYFGWSATAGTPSCQTTICEIRS